MSENPMCRKFYIHIDIRKYYVRELVLAGFLKLVTSRTHKMVADALTKNLPSPAFVGHRDRQIMTGHVSFTARLLHCIGSKYILVLLLLFMIFSRLIGFFSCVQSIIFLSVCPLFVS